jgi:hypothetical protein
MLRYFRRTIVGTLVLGMSVLASATPASATSHTTAAFDGVGFVHEVGKDAAGNVVEFHVKAVPYRVFVTEGGPGVGTLWLWIDLGAGLFPTSPSPQVVDSGLINVSTEGASGGGTLRGPASQMGWVATPAGGQFQCQFAGSFSAHFERAGIFVIQSDIHGTVSPGTFDAS